MHMERLRKIKPCIDMKKPPKPKHIVNNYKKELQKMERMSEIQYQNRVLLRKMLQIDLKPNTNTGIEVKQLKRVQSANGPRMMRPQSAKTNFTNQNQNPNQPLGLNSYNSLNRANRIRSLAKIIDENKVLLDKLQKTNSTYNNEKWRNDYNKSTKLQKMIRGNGDRYCKNPYFLHSLCTSSGPIKAYTDLGSVQGCPSQYTYYGGDNRTISEYGVNKKSKRGLGSRASEVQFGDQVGVEAPPKLKKKIRPFSAPRHQGLRSQGLKNKVIN